MIKVKLETVQKTEGRDNHFVGAGFKLISLTGAITLEVNRKRFYCGDEMTEAQAHSLIDQRSRYIVTVKD